MKQEPQLVLPTQTITTSGTAQCLNTNGMTRLDAVGDTFLPLFKHRPCFHRRPPIALFTSSSSFPHEASCTWGNPSFQGLSSEIFPLAFGVFHSATAEALECIHHMVESGDAWEKGWFVQLTTSLLRLECAYSLATGSYHTSKIAGDHPSSISVS
jgi:hypothetical protein